MTNEELWKLWEDQGYNEVIEYLAAQHPARAAIFIVQGTLDRRLSAADCNRVTNGLAEHSQDIEANVFFLAKQAAALGWDAYHLMLTCGENPERLNNGGLAEAVRLLLNGGDDKEWLMEKIVRQP